MESELFLPQQQHQRPIDHYPQPQADQYTHGYTYLPQPPPYTEHAHITSCHYRQGPASFVEEVSKEDLQNEENFVESTLQWVPRQPSPTRIRMYSLNKPVVIPRVDVTTFLRSSLPFLRAYSPALKAHDIHEADFLAFIDNLAVAQAGSPVFQAVDAAGMGIGFVPQLWAQAAGAGMQVAAGVGSAAVSAIRTKKFLARCNEQYFAPRGLKVSLKKDDEVSLAVGFPRNQRMLVPVDIGPSPIITLRDRRMAALAPYIAPLTTEVPPPTKQRNILDKIAAKQLERKTGKKEKVFNKKLQKAQEKQDYMQRLRGNGYNIGNEHHEVYIDDGSSSDSDSSTDSTEVKMAKLESETKKINNKADSESMKKGSSKGPKIEHDRSKELAKVKREKDKLERKINRRLEKEQEKGQKRDSKIEKKVLKMEYIVIENLV